MQSYRTHLFICTNGPDRVGKCGHKGSEDLRRRLKESCKKLYAEEVRVNASGCLGFCEQGIAAVCYPRSEWLLELKSTDDEKLLDAVKSSQT